MYRNRIDGKAADLVRAVILVANVYSGWKNHVGHIWPTAYGKACHKCPLNPPRPYGRSHFPPSPPAFAFVRLDRDSAAL
jgi:hypothetical protein